MTQRTRGARFCQNNLASASGATLSVSSAKAGFPGSNTVNPARYLRWITTGAFRITSSNCKLYIDDGTPQTITLTPGTYATAAALATHIQTELNAASSDWTCSYSTSTTYKFTIGRSSGTAMLVLSSTTDAVWDTLGFVGSTDVSTGTGLDADEVRIHTSERWRVDLGASKLCRAFHVIGAGDTPFPISSAAVLTLKADDVAASLDPGGSPELSISLAREETGVFRYLDDLSNTTIRYWEFEFQDRLNPNGPEFAIHNIYLGDYVTPMSRQISNGFRRRHVDPSRTEKSQGGVPFSSLQKKYWVYENTGFQYLSGSDRTELERIIQELGTTNPFFFSLDPLVEVSASLGEMTKYVRFIETEIDHFRASKHMINLVLEERIA